MFNMFRNARDEDITKLENKSKSLEDQVAALTKLLSTLESKDVTVPEFETNVREQRSKDEDIKELENKSKMLEDQVARLIMKLSFLENNDFKAPQMKIDVTPQEAKSEDVIKLENKSKMLEDQVAVLTKKLTLLEKNAVNGIEDEEIQKLENKSKTLEEQVAELTKKLSLFEKKDVKGAQPNYLASNSSPVENQFGPPLQPLHEPHLHQANMSFLGPQQGGYSGLPPQPLFGPTLGGLPMFQQPGMAHPMPSPSGLQQQHFHQEQEFLQQRPQFQHHPRGPQFLQQKRPQLWQLPQAQDYPRQRFVHPPHQPASFHHAPSNFQRKELTNLKNSPSERSASDGIKNLGVEDRKTETLKKNENKASRDGKKNGAQDTKTESSKKGQNKGKSTQEIVNERPLFLNSEKNRSRSQPRTKNKEPNAETEQSKPEIPEAAGNNEKKVRFAAQDQGRGNGGSGGIPTGDQGMLLKSEETSSGSASVPKTKKNTGNLATVSKQTKSIPDVVDSTKNDQKSTTPKPQKTITKSKKKRNKAQKNLEKGIIQEQKTMGMSPPPKTPPLSKKNLGPNDVLMKFIGEEIPSMVDAMCLNIDLRTEVRGVILRSDPNSLVGEVIGANTLIDIVNFKKKYPNAKAILI